MKMLAIETSSQYCSASLLLDKEIKEHHETAPMQQAQKILPMIDALLKENKMTLNQLDALAFGCGPGSFTGVRIAVSVIQGLGFGLDLPIIAISSLAALAQQVYLRHGWKNLLVAVDARINEIYWAEYQVNHQGLVVPVNNEKIIKPCELPPIHLLENWQGAGNAWEIYQNQLPYRPDFFDADTGPTASAVLVLAQAKYEKGEWVSASNAAPVYLREEVAIKAGKS